MHNNSKIRLIDYGCFCDAEGFLDRSFGVYANNSDPIHLGKPGIRKLAKMFMDSIFRKHRDGRSYRSVLTGNGERGKQSSHLSP